MRIAALLSLVVLVLSACVVTVARDDERDDYRERNRSTSNSQSASAPPATNEAQAERRADVVVAAMGALGTPYRYGGRSGESGYDCSGFVQVMYRENAGAQLPRIAADQAAATRRIDREHLQPGDLVFFNTQRRPYSHVGIYVGDHRFIHSPKSGGEVRMEDMRVNYWSQRFNGARRVDLPPLAAR